MPSAKKKNKVGRLTGGSDKEREALQLRTYDAHLQNNKALQGIAVSTDSIASPEQRTGIFSLMNILNEEGVLQKVIFYQLQRMTGVLTLANRVSATRVPRRRLKPTVRKHKQLCVICTKLLKHSYLKTWNWTTMTNAQGYAYTAKDAREVENITTT